MRSRELGKWEVQWIVGSHVVIAGYGQHWRTQSNHKGLGRAKLSGQHTMRDVARQQHHIRPLLSCEGDKGFAHLRLFGSEVRVGSLQQHTHTAASGASAEPSSSPVRPARSAPR